MEDERRVESEIDLQSCRGHWRSCLFLLGQRSPHCCSHDAENDAAAVAAVVVAVDVAAEAVAQAVDTDLTDAVDVAGVVAPAEGAEDVESAEDVAAGAEIEIVDFVVERFCQCCQFPHHRQHHYHHHCHHDHGDHRALLARHYALPRRLHPHSRCRCHWGLLPPLRRHHHLFVDVWISTWVSFSFSVAAWVFELLVDAVKASPWLLARRLVHEGSMQTTQRRKLRCRQQWSGRERKV